MPSILSETNPVDTPPAAFRRLRQLAMPSRLTVVLVSLLLATPALMFWLCLVIVPARVAILCPEECGCETAGFVIECNGTSLNSLPLIHFPYVQKLDLYEYNITVLKKDSFVSLSGLDTLYMSKCGVRTIELGAFNRLTEVTELSILKNVISEILPGTFEDMNSLEYLKISENRIEHLHSDVFSGLVNLKVIYLTHNKLQYINPDTFLRLPNLQHLYLSSNPTLQIPTDRPFINSHSLPNLDISDCNVSSVSVETFANVSALEFLDLSGNNLRTVDISILRALPNLQILVLSYNPTLQIPTDRNFINSHSLSRLEISNCNVSLLSVETFANVSALESLDLSNNELMSVDINILKSLPKLSTLSLYGNPLQCDCQLQEVWRWCEDRNIETGQWRIVPECDTPSEVEGMWWGVLQKGECLDGNIEYYGDYNCTSYIYTGIEYKLFSEYVHEFLKNYQLEIFAFPFIFGTTGNVILLIIIICNKDMRTIPNMYILNLAVSDITNLTVLFSEVCTNTISDEWLKGDFMCKILPFCRRMSVGLSAYSVAVYSLQRYRVIVNPFQVLVSSQAKWRVTVATICGVWIVAALFAVPSALSDSVCEVFDRFRIIRYYHFVVVFELSVSCVLPLCVITFSYAIIARHLLTSSRSISEGTQNPQLKARRNTAKSVVGLALVFVISYVPYHVFWTYFMYSEEISFGLTTTEFLDHSIYTIPYTFLISTSLLLINSCLNPVALFCTSSQFRQHLKRYLTCFCKTNSSPTDFELTRRN